MRHNRVLALSVLFLLLTAAAEATPFFARAYNFPCSTCHNGFPRLNSFGLAFKANNFRIPGAEKSAPLAWQKTVPLAVQVVPVYRRFSPGGIKGQSTDTQLLGGGLLTSTTAFYVHHSLWVDARPTSFPSYEAWVQQVLDERSKLMLKIGQFELPLLYSPFIHLATVSPPALFGAGHYGNDVRLFSTVRGVQLSGRIAGQAQWYLVYSTPSATDPGNQVGRRVFFDFFRDVFLRISSADPERNIGLFYYSTRPLRNRADPSTRDRGERFGLEGAYTWEDYRFYGGFLYGENSDPRGDGSRGVIRGAYLEVEKPIIPRLLITGRWDTVTVNTATTHSYSEAKTFSLRFYPRDRLKLLLEYQDRSHGGSSISYQAAIAF